MICWTRFWTASQRLSPTFLVLFRNLASMAWERGGWAPRAKHSKTLHLLRPVMQRGPPLNEQPFALMRPRTGRA